MVGAAGYSLAWFGLACVGLAWWCPVWPGLTWSGMVWHGLAWFGLVWLNWVWLGLVSVIDSLCVVLFCVALRCRCRCRCCWWCVVLRVCSRFVLCVYFAMFCRGVVSVLHSCVFCCPLLYWFDGVFTWCCV